MSNFKECFKTKKGEKSPWEKGFSLLVSVALMLLLAPINFAFAEIQDKNIQNEQLDPLIPDDTLNVEEDTSAEVLNEEDALEEPLTPGESQEPLREAELLLQNKTAATVTGDTSHPVSSQEEIPIESASILAEDPLMFAKVYSGGVSIGGGKRDAAYAGEGTIGSPYRFLVASSRTSNPYTQPSSFWGEAQSTSSKPAQFAVTFEQRAGVDENTDPASGALMSSMAFNTITGKNPNWVDFSIAPRISPVSAFDTSDGILKIAFAWKGNFSTYFSDWAYTFNAASLTTDLAEDERLHPGDKVKISYYGGYLPSQTSRGTNYSIDFSTADETASFVRIATVEEDGYVRLSGEDMILYGGNYSVEKMPESVTAVSVAGVGGATEIAVKEGTLQMIATVTPDNASNKAVTWSVEPNTVATIDEHGLLTAMGDGVVTVRATSVDDLNIFGEAAITITGHIEEKEIIVYRGSMAIGEGSRANAYDGDGTSENPYRFLVAATTSSTKNSNPYTPPSSFWGESQSGEAAPAKFAVEFIQRTDMIEGSSPLEGTFISSMAFDTLISKNSDWANFSNLAPRMSPVTAFDTSTGELRLAFAFKGDFSAYFTDWTFTMAASSLTTDLADSHRLKSGDTVYLVHYGNFDLNQTSRGTDYSIDFANELGGTDEYIKGVVDKAGNVSFSGHNMIKHGGNYRVTKENPTGSDEGNDNKDDDNNDNKDESNSGDKEENSSDKKSDSNNPKKGSTNNAMSENNGRTQNLTSSTRGSSFFNTVVPSSGPLGSGSSASSDNSDSETPAAYAAPLDDKSSSLAANVDMQSDGEKESTSVAAIVLLAIALCVFSAAAIWSAVVMRKRKI